MGVAFVVAGAAQGLGRLIAWRLSHRNKHKKSMKPRLAETEKSALSAERTSRLHGTGVTLKRENKRPKFEPRKRWRFEGFLVSGHFWLFWEIKPSGCAFSEGFFLEKRGDFRGLFRPPYNYQ